jgi:hypothetical protein
MHSYILDGEGREAAHVFYKAAFYDRSAHMEVYDEADRRAYDG